MLIFSSLPFLDHRESSLGRPQDDRGLEAVLWVSYVFSRSWK